MASTMSACVLAAKSATFCFDFFLCFFFFLETLVAVQFALMSLLLGMLVFVGVADGVVVGGLEGNWIDFVISLNSQMKQRSIKNFK